MSAAGCVALGSALLDAKRPGWASRIDRASLRVAGCCPLDQSFGSYARGKKALDLNEAEAVDHGFSWPVPCVDAYYAARYVAALDAEWARVIAERESAL